MSRLNTRCSRLVACLLLQGLLWPRGAAAVASDPCSELAPVRKGEPFVVGLVYWPGGLESDWGPADSGLQPCNATVQASLTAQGAMFATFNVKTDRLTVLKTSFPEELILTGRAAPGAKRVISLVAFRAGVRSSAQYIASFEPSVTSGTGFVPSGSVIAKFELGTLKHLQFYNLTCNDCGGRTSARCINATSCAMAPSECTCSSSGSSGSSNSSSSSSPAPSSSPSPAVRRRLLDGAPAAAGDSDNTSSPMLGQNETQMSGTSVCNYANFSFCATGINLAFDGIDVNSAAFTTAAQVRKLTSFSLVSLYFTAKQAFFNVKDMFVDKTGEYWGKFGAVQQDIQAAYSGNAAAYTDQASAGGLAG